ncbi:hypothetical protein BKA62DRAFT_706577 [Auriculariales sp. MPI-PUGE-AT-0066]|nr:hypothetical protein BKA62DRAFT_706577 [Auriculariales sp. MPI-PUGE-AT-0066]
MPRRCPICKSKSWRKETGTGMIICSEGHVLQNYRNESNEQDASHHALKRMRLKSQRKRKGVKSRTNPYFYHGDRGMYLYFQCQQLLLRKQIEVVTKLWHLPAEFEVLCRDIWAVKLASHPDPPPPEPYWHNADHDRPKPSSQPDKTRRSSGSDSESGSDENERRVRDLMDAISDSETEDESDSSDEDQASMTGDQDGPGDTAGDENAEVDASSRTLSPQRSRKWRQRNFPDLMLPAANIAVMNVACWILRIPVTCMDFVSLIDDYQLPYLESLHQLPETMKRHISTPIARLINPKLPPRPPHLHHLSSVLAGKLKERGIPIPEFNVAPALWRAVHVMSCSPVLFHMAKSIGRACNVPFTLHPSVTPWLTHAPEEERHLHKDGTERVPRMETDPALALPSLKGFLQVLRAAESAALKTRQYLFSSRSDASTLDFSVEQIDQFLDFFQLAIVDKKSEHCIPTIAQCSLSTASSVQVRGLRAEAVPCSTTAALEVNYADSNTHALLPGGLTCVFDAHDTAGTIPSDLNTVLAAGVRWTGFPVDSILVAVEIYERRLVHWWQDQQE